MVQKVGRWYKHESRITGAEMRCLRNCMGKTRRDRIRSSESEGIINQEPVTQMVGRRELRCFGHLTALDKNGKPRYGKQELWDRGEEEG
jgi:hypothetical protein